MATHSSVLAWRIPGMAEPGGLLSLGSHRVGHNWSDLAAAAATDGLAKTTYHAQQEAQNLDGWKTLKYIIYFEQVTNLWCVFSHSQITLGWGLRVGKRSDGYLHYYFCFWLCWVFVAVHGLSLDMVHGLSGPATCGILVPCPGIKPKSPWLQGRFFTTGLWKSLHYCYFY